MRSMVSRDDPVKAAPSTWIDNPEATPEVGRSLTLTRR